MESISAVENSLNDLEDALAPLFETDLSETEAKLDILQKAKLQVLLPYVVNNLVFCMSTSVPKSPSYFTKRF